MIRKLKNKITDNKNHVSNSKHTFLKLYYQLLRIRMVEEAIATEYLKQEMRCPVHLCIGQEAPPVGVSSHLQKSDMVFSNHRSHGHYLAKGGNVEKMIAEIYGKGTGASHGRGGSQHLIDLSVNFIASTPIVAGTIPIATGAALSIKLKKEKRIAVSYFGDAAVEEGVTHESFNFASLKELPILYICENNLYSILTPITDRQPSRPIHTLVAVHGIATYVCDGNDVMDIYLKAEKAIKYIRQGRGPAFLECRTYRIKEHCGPLEEPVGSRPEAEIVTWKRKDPIKRFEKYLLQRHILDEKTKDTITKKIDREIRSAFLKAQASPFPEEVPSREQVYAE
jgi:TPP-dependent pyruvate/acetoin dehydrogenase alpha subunit